MEYCSHVWCGAPKSSLHLLDGFQSKTTCLINNPNLTNSLQSLFHRRLVADLSIFYRYFHGHFSQDIKNVITDTVMHVRSTRSSTYSHPFQVTLPNPRTLAHKTSFIPRTSQLQNSEVFLSISPIKFLLVLHNGRADFVISVSAFAVIRAKLLIYLYARHRLTWRIYLTLSGSLNAMK